MNFKNYDILSSLVLGYILLMALLPMIGLTYDWEASIAYLSIAYVIGYTNEEKITHPATPLKNKIE